MSFTSLGLSSALMKALDNQNFTQAYPIQEKAIPSILKKRDVLGIAKTGSGKTASYVLPILQNLEGVSELKNRHVNVLVMVPTRELAEQVKDVFQMFSKELPYPVKTVAVYGGVSINPQMIAMQGANVLVATPGRLIDLVESNAVHLSDINMLILDEADKMLNLGFKVEMKRIFGLLPAMRQNLLFSATLSDDIEKINQILLNSPEVIKIDEDESCAELIEQTAYFIDEEKKGPLLRYIIKKHDLHQILVFASSTYKCDNIADKLRKNGIEATAIHSKKGQKARLDSLRKFKSGKIRVLVTTDLLARGIDIEYLPCVINYELPRSPKDYVHRIGRTGRADNPGIAISLVSEEEQHHFKIIQKKMGKWVDRVNIDNVDLTGC